MVHSAEMRAAESHLLNVRSLNQKHTRTSAPAAKFFQLSELRRLRRSEQVAAVCYRIRGKAIEFLLVQTRGGRRIFPKGSAEPGLTHAQAAALEAFEEAGVHGRIEEASFARYVRRERGGKKVTVNAHLCEVSRLSTPKESRRDRTWFAAEDAKCRLREGRESTDGLEFARVVGWAVARIQRLRGGNSVVDGRRGELLQPDRSLATRSLPGQALREDALQRVPFEASEVRSGEAAWMQYVRWQVGGTRQLVAPVVEAHPRSRGEVLQFESARKKTKALGTGANPRR